MSSQEYDYGQNSNMVAPLENGKVPTANLGSGTPDASKVLKGDQSWGSGGSGAAWGDITGTLSAQIDLDSALDGKEPADADIQTHITGTGSPHTAAGIGAEASGAVSTHAALATGVHGAGGSTLATTGNITTHAAVTASVHNFDASGNAPPQAHNQDASTINAGTLDGDRLPVMSTTKKGGVLATGTPSGKYLKDDTTWGVPSAALPDLVQTANTSAGANQTINAGYSAYIPMKYEIVNTYSLTVANTAFCEIG